ncbi:Telomere replication protein EST3 [Nakaseomyces bracarensis]|uniref:Telomere replication protein EST3 n=1 Tax=Nakaseomyces bracarensis TaxID=273131 RepID=A0ABR4NSJ4_9SACH
MPPYHLKSRTNSVESIYLHSWILPCLNRYLERHSVKVVQRIKPKDIRFPILSPSIYRNKRHFVKPTRFYKVDNYTVYASVKDSSHQILS